MTPSYDDDAGKHSPDFVAGPQPLSLSKNVAWMFAGNVVNGLCQWGILIALTKLGTAEIVGQYALGLAVSGPILMFASLQLRTLQATDSRRQFDFGDYFGLILLSTSVGWLAVTGVACWESHNVETLWVISAVGLGKVFEQIANTFYGLLQQRERLDRIMKSGVFHGISSLTALCLGVWLTGNVLWGSVGYAAMRLLVIVTYDIPGVLWVRQLPGSAVVTSRWLRLKDALCEIRPRWEWSRLWPLARLGLPMGVMSLLLSLQTNVPRYFVAMHFGKAELGMLCAIVALVTAGVTVMRAIDHSSIPRLAQLHASGQLREFRWLFLKLVTMYLLLGAVGVWVARCGGRTLLSWLFQPEYAIHTDVFETVMLLAVMAYLAGAISSALVASRIITVQMPLQCLSLLATCGTSYWLVPEFGLWGASMSLALSKLPFITIGMVLLIRATQVVRPPEIPCRWPRSLGYSSEPRTDGVLVVSQNLH